MTQPDAGPMRVRRAFSRSPKLVGMTVLIDRAQLATLETFVTEDLKYGSLAFILPDPHTDGWSISDESGIPLTDEAGNQLTMIADWLCLFSQQGLPSFTPNDLEFRVSFQIMVLPL